MTILLTGGSGFFGWNATRYYQERGHSVVACSSHPERYRNFPEKPEFHEANIFDQKQILALCDKYYPDFILHAAALSQPSECEINPIRATQTNVIGTTFVFGAAAALNIPIVLLSTDLVFDGSKSYYTERDNAEPKTEYGKSKLEAEQLILGQKLYHNWIILRPALMFGNGASWTNGFPQFALRSMAQKKATNLFHDQFRTPIYTDDLAEAIERIVKQERFGEIFHAGGAERINRVDFVRRYCAVAGLSTEYIRAISMDDVPEYSTRVADVSLDSGKLRAEIQWSPTSLETAFEEMVRRA